MQSGKTRGGVSGNIIAVSLGVFIVLGMICYGLWMRIHTFRVEDAIHRSFGPTILAIYNYEEAEKRWPASLQELVPRYMTGVPQSRYADRYEYRNMTNEWEFAVYSRALGVPRVYLHRSTGTFNSNEVEHTVLEYHGMWRVIEGDR